MSVCACVLLSVCGSLCVCDGVVEGRRSKDCWLQCSAYSEGMGRMCCGVFCCVLMLDLLCCVVEGRVDVLLSCLF